MIVRLGDPRRLYAFLLKSLPILVALMGIHGVIKGFVSDQAVGSVIKLQIDVVRFHFAPSIARRPMPKGDSWSWHVFFGGFWGAFGRMMAGFSAVFVFASLVADTSSATFDSAAFGLLFAVVCAAIYGYSEGDKAIRDWRSSA